MKYLLLFFFFLPFVTLAQNDFEKAEKLFVQKRFSQAQPLFESSLKQNPTNLKALEYLGDIQCFSKNWEVAASYYMKLKTLRPNEADFQYKYGGALAMYAKESNKVKAMGMIDDVKSAFLKAIQNDPKHLGARWALVELYLQLPGILGGSENKANQYARELFKLSPVDGYLAKGRIAEYFERYNEAANQYKIAIQNENSKIAYQKLADLYKNKLNQPEKARQIMLEFTEKNKS